MADPVIVCAECGEEAPRTGRRQLYCKPCAKSRWRVAHAASEKRRRARLDEEYREYERTRYADNLKVAEQKKAAARRRYAQLSSTEEGRERWRATVRKANQRYRDKHLYGGNRAAVFARDGGACRRCGTSEQLHVHHLDGRGWTTPVEEKNNEVRNLVLLCAACHARTHRENEARTKAKV